MANVKITDLSAYTSLLGTDVLPIVDVTNDVTKKVSVADIQKYYDSDASNYVAFAAPGTVTANVTWTLPAADGTTGQALVTNGSGTLGWSTISGGGGGGVSDGQYGDIDVTGSGSQWTINADVVTYDKIQDTTVSDVILGRSSQGGGTVEEITCTSAGRDLLDDADAAAQRTTLGLGTAATSASGDFFAASGVSTFGATLIDDADAAAARTTLGVEIGVDVQAHDANTAKTNAAQDFTSAQTFSSDVTLNAQSDLRFADADSSNWVAFQAPATIQSNVTWTLPAADGSTGQALTTNGSGTLSWATISGGGGGGGVSDADYGDISVTNSGALWTVDDGAISYAKIQDVSATDKILGRSSQGSGDVEEITCTAAGRALLDDQNAAAMRSTLGLGIGSDVQAYNAQLDTLAGLSNADGNIIVGTGQAFGVESGQTARASLGLAIGSDVLAYDADLNTIAGLSNADGNFIVGTGQNWGVESGQTARQSLGLDIGVDVQAYDANTAVTDVVQSFTKQQRSTIVTLQAVQGTFTADFNDGNIYACTLAAGSNTFANPSNLAAGASGVIYLAQGQGNSTVTWGSYWKFPGGTAPTLSTAASAVDAIAFCVRSTTSITATALLNV